MVGTAERVLDKALALHVAEPGLIPGMDWVPQTLSGVAPELRTRNNP